ncbi:hypothetical protein [Shimia marina]|uniref:Uncharacterized protein n=1 Tax=Shimia marina TaxID=321267 RepID=A0A0P1ESN3_9RHOB|nr:hypothetical protein [Shimia marina]CUH52951.1 hypothetical protein SHM7688_02398 [Shimia marina]SFD90953.1 hypothetical protein SAMN04488037_103199 [Shimia marina]
MTAKMRKPKATRIRQTLSQGWEEIAKRVVASMQTQGYCDVEYVVSDQGVNILARASGQSTRRHYLTVSGERAGHGRGGADKKAPRFVL